MTNCELMEAGLVPLALANLLMLTLCIFQRNSFKLKSIMPTIEDFKALSEWSKGLINKIAQVQEEKGVRASGFSRDSLRFETDRKGVSIFGEEYFEYQEFGLPPFGEGPPLEAYPTVEDILQWMEDKPVVVEGDPIGVAFAIVDKIFEEGTITYSNLSNGLPLTQIYNEEIPKLSPMLEQSNVVAIARQFDSRYKG